MSAHIQAENLDWMIQLVLFDWMLLFNLDRVWGWPVAQEGFEASFDQKIEVIQWLNSNVNSFLLLSDQNHQVVFSQ